ERATFGCDFLLELNYEVYYMTLRELTNYSLQLLRPKVSTRRSNWSLHNGEHSTTKVDAERPSLRLPPIAEEPRVHRRGVADARPGHRSQHGDVQFRSWESRPCSAVAFCLTKRFRATTVWCS